MTIGFPTLSARLCFVPACRTLYLRFIRFASQGFGTYATQFFALLHRLSADCRGCPGTDLKKEGKSVIGSNRLLNQSLNTSYQPKRTGKRMACLCDDVQLRIDFIGFLKDLYAKARTVLERWKSGDYSLPYPLGLYPPSMPKLAEPIGIW